MDEKSPGRARAAQIILWKTRTDFRAIFLSLLLTLLAHASAFFAASHLLTFSKIESPEEVEIEFVEPPAEKFKLPQYVEANPDANSETPLNTPLESFKNQKAAQENPDRLAMSNRPKVEGENEHSQKIVRGTLQNERAPQSPFDTLKRPLENPSGSNSNLSPNPPSPAPQTSTLKNAQNNPDSGATPGGAKADKQNIAPSAPPAPEIAELKTEGAIPVKPAEKSPAPSAKEKGENAAAAAEASIKESMRSLPAPKPRKRISMSTPDGPLGRHNVKANAYGALAVDSRFSEFGAYQQRMIEAICRQWYILASKCDTSGEINTSSTVEFYLNTSGEITSLKTLYTTSTPIGENLCAQAILSTAPYGEWTGEMRAAFGDKDQPVKIQFHYR